MSVKQQNPNAYEIPRLSNVLLQFQGMLLENKEGHYIIDEILSKPIPFFLKLL